MLILLRAFVDSLTETLEKSTPKIFLSFTCLLRFIAKSALPIPISINDVIDFSFFKLWIACMKYLRCVLPLPKIFSNLSTFALLFLFFNNLSILYK